MWSPLLWSSFPFLLLVPEWDRSKVEFFLTTKHCMVGMLQLFVTEFKATMGAYQAHPYKANKHDKPCVIRAIPSQTYGKWATSMSHAMKQCRWVSRRPGWWLIFSAVDFQSNIEYSLRDINVSNFNFNLTV